MNVARLRLGARCVVFNNRGRGGHVLKTARTYCASKTDDLAAVIDHIKAKNPNASLMALGVSLGKFLCTVKVVSTIISGVLFARISTVKCITTIEAFYL